MRHAAHTMGPVGRVPTDRFDPSRFLRSWNFESPGGRAGALLSRDAAPDGTLFRRRLVACDREIEIAPGMFFPAWTFNGQVPGPTLRATEGDRVKVTFVNQGTHPHTIHFHGWHPPEMDGSLPEHQVMPGATFVYEFDADPFGVHLYHCHAVPLKRHMHKGLYGMFIVDPRTARPAADELVMVMKRSYDTNFDSDSEATRSIRWRTTSCTTRSGWRSVGWSACTRQRHRVRSDQQPAPPREFFDVFRTGTMTFRADRYRDAVSGSARSGTRFRYPGKFMFHAERVRESSAG